MEKLNVFIFAADEPIGFEIVNNLINNKKFKEEVYTVYAGILDRSKREELKRLGAEVVKYEQDNLSSTQLFLEKSDIVVLICSIIDYTFILPRLMLREVTAAKVQNVHLIFQFNSDKESLWSPLRGFKRLEIAYKKLKFKGSIIQCGFLSDNLPHAFLSIRNVNKINLNLGNGIVTLIPKNDVSFSVTTHLIAHYKEVETLSKGEALVLTGDKQ